MGERILDLLRQGWSYNAIVAELGCSKSSIHYRAKQLGITKTLRVYDWKAVQEYHDLGHNMTECRKRFGFCTDAWDKAVERGDLDARPWQIALEALLVNGRKTGRRHLKNRLLKAGHLPDHCHECGPADWRGRKLPLELHHINGTPDDNRQALTLLCPNCHSLTPNYCGKNVKRKAPLLFSA